MKSSVIALIIVFFVWTASCQREITDSSAASRRPVEWVKPVIDTVHSRWIFFSSACRPFGMVNLSPDTTTKGDWGSGYLYTDKTIRCFSHIHDWQLAGLAVMPVSGDCSGHLGMDSYQSGFSHDDEVVQAGYHKVVLNKYGITAELTSTTRVGFHRYRFSPGQVGRVLIDTASPLMDCSMIASEAKFHPDKKELEGFVTLSKTMRRPKPVTVYFVIQFNRPFDACGGWKDGKLLAGQPAEIIGPNAGEFVEFKPSDEPVLMKVAISYTGIEGARKNLNAELAHWDFDRVRRESADEWNSWLGRIEVQGGTNDQKTKFYTDLWHALLGRRIVSDVDGSYIDNTGSSPIIRRVTPTASGNLFPHYGFDAWWGSHWNLNILWPMAWPEVMDGFCTTMVDMYRNGGLIPRGPSGGNYTFVMIGDPAVSFFAAAYHLGIRSWDVQKAYEGLRKNAFPGGIRDHAGYEHDAKASAGGMSYYVQQGYVPEGIPGKGMHRDGASMTLEYAYQDWCLAQLALSLEKTQDAELFTKRSQNYRHLWNPESSWMHPRTLDGEWITDFSPIGSGGSTKGFTEANSAIYTYFVPQDPQGLIALFGGADPFIQRLNSQFTKARPLHFIVPHGKHAEGWTDYENQPGLGMAYWFSYAGSPWLTQQWVRCIHDAAFSDVSPMGGYNGDEDQGQMGAYSALASMGLFALDGCASADPHYEITCPIFDTITIHLNPKYHPGKTFVIKTKNNAKENLYIQSAKLNGKDLNTFQFPCRSLTAGGTLEIVAGPDPNKQWGVSGK